MCDLMLVVIVITMHIVRVYEGSITTIVVHGQC